MTQAPNESLRVTLADLLVQAQPWQGQAAGSVDCHDMEGFERDEPMVRTDGAIPHGAQIVRPGDVLLSVRFNAPRRAWVVGDARGRPQVATADWLVLRSDAFEPAYLRHLLVSNEFELCFRKIAPKRGARAKTSGVLFEGIAFASPAKEVQRRAAHILDHADGLRAKRSLVAERSRELMAALFAEQFGSSLESELPTVPLESLLQAPPCRGVDVPTEAQGRFALVRTTDLQDGWAHLTAARYVSRSDAHLALTALADGDVLVAREPGRMGQRVAIASPGDAVWFLHAKLWRLRPEMSRVLPEYLRAWLDSPAGQLKLAQVWFSVGARGRTEHRLSTIEVPLPSIDEQRRFRERVQAVEGLASRWNASAQRLDALLGTLRDLAYCGELKLA